MSRSRASLVVFSWIILLVGGARGVEQPADLVRAEPAQAGNLVVCHLQTRNLPGEKQLQTMRSGLESALDLNLVLLDADDRVLGGNLVTLRMAFDLWDEVFSVRGDGRERRFRTLPELRAYLMDLGDLPVAPLSQLGPDGRYRLRVGLVVHTIAPDERARVEDMVVGDRRSPGDGSDRQEVSVSLGRLIRMFYKGGGGGDGGQELLSGWFTAKELSDATH